MSSLPPIEAVMPHKLPMLLIDELVAYDLEAYRLDCTATPRAGAPFFDAAYGAIPAWVGVEYMAQGIAALSGVARWLEGGSPRIGFIIGVRDFESVVESFPGGETLNIHVAQILRDGNVVSFQCEIASGERTLQLAIINAFEVESEAIDYGRS